MSKEPKVITLGTMPNGYTAKTREIAKRLHLDKASIKDVAAEYGVIYQRVSQIKRETARIVVEPIEKFKVLLLDALRISKLPKALENRIIKAIEGLGINIRGR